MNNPLQKIFGLIAGILIAFLVFFAVFPMVLTGTNIISGTHNVTEYTGLVDMVNLGPLMVMFGGTVAIIGGAAAGLFGDRAKQVTREVYYKIKNRNGG